MIHVTTHAIERWIERIDQRATWEQAKAALHAMEPSVRAAATIGCNTVKLGCGGRLVLDGAKIVTVLSRDQVHFQHCHLPPLDGRRMGGLRGQAGG